MPTYGESQYPEPRIAEAYFQYLQGVNMLVNPSYTETVLGNIDKDERVVAHAEMLMYMGLKRAIYYAGHETTHVVLPKIEAEPDAEKPENRIAHRYMKAYDDLPYTGEDKIRSINPSFLTYLPQPLTDRLVSNLVSDNFGEVITASLTDGYGPNRQFEKIMYGRTLQDTKDYFSR